MNQLLWDHPHFEEIFICGPVKLKLTHRANLVFFFVPLMKVLFVDKLPYCGEVFEAETFSYVVHVEILTDCLARRCTCSVLQVSAHTF